jgi:hypothetical protein
MSEAYKLVGTIKVLNDTVQVSEKFSKRELVVTVEDGMYPQDISLQFTQDKTSVLDAMNVGDKVEVSFNLRGREWTSPTGEVKYFNSLEGWRIEKMLAPVAPTRVAQAAESTSEEQSDLPF